MGLYTPQVADIKHTLEHVVGLPELIGQGVFPDLGMDTVEAVLAEAGRFAAEVVAPLNREGDRQGCRLDTATHAVTTAPGWKDAYAKWVEAGWGSLPCPSEFGGQGLPTLVSLAVQELWNTASSAYGIGTLLTQGAVDALAVHGSEALKATYLPKMVSGEWTGTMNLTEPQAGSDLGSLRTKAERVGDGSYRITGTKIFITYGEHDLTPNIVHLVLARLVDAPEGTRGISLFLVPRDLPDGTRNDVKCIGLEEKLGIHGSPTCVMRYGDAGGAVGHLVGEENRGLACMFTMMNNARLHVGMQGVAVAERATQQAVAYARERRQGRRPGIEGAATIIEHPDVRRMLLDMRAKTAAARAVCYETARALDLSEHAGSAGERAANAALAALLTPVAKAWSTDIGEEVATLGIQVHGGMGFIEETGAAQHLRDARICRIYEGTNGIQAIDLVTRKLPLEDFRTVERWLAGVRALAEGMTKERTGEAAEIGLKLGEAVTALEDATGCLAGWLKKEPDRALAAATPYLALFGLVAGGAGLAKGARALLARGANDDFQVRLASWFAFNHLPLAQAHRDIVAKGGDILLAVPPDRIG